MELLRRSFLIAAFALAPMVASAVRADTLVLKSGDRLTGTIEVSDDKDVTLETDFAAEIKDHWSTVQNVKSDKPVYVVMPDKSTVNGTLSTDGANIVVHPASGAPVQLPIAAVTVVRSSALEAAYEKTLHPNLLGDWAVSTWDSRWRVETAKQQT